MPIDREETKKEVRGLIQELNFVAEELESLLIEFDDLSNDEYEEKARKIAIDAYIMLGLKLY